MGSFETEDEAFSYAYNEGHADNRKKAAYKPNPSIKDTSEFKKIYKQRAESFQAEAECSKCLEMTDELELEENDDLCSYCRLDARWCHPGNHETSGDLVPYEGPGETCLNCSRRCENRHCMARYADEDSNAESIKSTGFCDSCLEEYSRCEDCDDLMLEDHKQHTCELCEETFCEPCGYNRGFGDYSKKSDPDYSEGDACKACILSDSSLIMNAETFDASYAGAGSLMSIGKDTGLGSFTSKELTESSAIHGDFDSASLNYSGKQNLEVRAEASDSYDDRAEKAYQEYVELGWANTNSVPPMSFEEWYEQTMAIYDTPEYDNYLEQQYLQMQEDEEELARQLMTLEADWRDLSRDSSGRWQKSSPDSEISDEEMQSYIIGAQYRGPSQQTESKITLRELAELMDTMTGNLLGFSESYRTVVEMLGSKDSSERREALYATIEECILTMDYYEETDYDGDVQTMVDIMRQSGIAPPEDFEEEVMARYQFEDKYAAEDKKILKPEVPADYNINETFGNNMILMSEDSGMSDNQIVELIESPFWEAWTTSTTPVNPGWWNLTLSVRDLKMWTRGIKANRNWKVSDVKSYFNIRGNKESLVTQIEAIQRLINNLQEGDSGSVARVNGIIEEYFHHVSKEAEEEDDGPTIEDFQRDVEKLFNKYGEFTWDSEAEEEGLYFSGMLFPSNGAYNFFQYDEDFSE